MAEQFFEMLWNCEPCGTHELLAKSQRHCPMCGAAQDPKQRYFPEPDQEVEAKGHRYVGVDWACTYCESPNSAAAVFCINCGGPKEGAKNVARVIDTAAQTTAPTPLASALATPPRPPTAPGANAPGLPTGFKWFMAILGVVAVGCAYLVIQFVIQLFSLHGERVQLVEKSWSRSVAVEHFTAVKSSDWCDAMPAGAYQIRSTQAQRSTREIQTGEVCVNTRNDMGDGTFTKHRECTPSFRQEPVFDAQCSYLINRWQVLRTDDLAGGAQLAPAWPSPVLANPLLQGDSVGAQRVGLRGETYRVTLRSQQGDSWQCELSEQAWTSLAENQSMALQVRGTGGANCDSLSPAP